MTTSIGSVFELLIAYAVFGLCWMILGGILYAITPIMPAGAVTDFAGLIWWGVVVIYLIFGAIYFWNQIRIWRLGHG